MCIRDSNKPPEFSPGVLYWCSTKVSRAKALPTFVRGYDPLTKTVRTPVLAVFVEHAVRWYWKVDNVSIPHR